MTTRNNTMAKRRREQALKERSRERDERRAERRARKGAGGTTDGEDPQIAGIVPGPQAPTDTD
jgi:hypothetical protein